MQQRLTAIIEGIRAEGNFAMVIDMGNPAVTQLIVAYDKSLDITERVASGCSRATDRAPGAGPAHRRALSELVGGRVVGRETSC